MDFFVLESQLNEETKKNSIRYSQEQFERVLKFIEENLLDKFDDRLNRIYANVKLFLEKFHFKGSYYKRQQNGETFRVKRLPGSFKEYLKRIDIKITYAQSVHGNEVMCFTKIDGHELKNNRT